MLWMKGPSDLPQAGEMRGVEDAADLGVDGRLFFGHGLWHESALHVGHWCFRVPAAPVRLPLRHQGLCQRGIWLG